MSRTTPDIYQVETQYLKDQEMEINMGPQHPSTHGVLRFRAITDGEMIRKVIPDVGYLHRSIEKIGELVDYHGFMPYTDRVDYVSAMTSNHAYARSVEKILEVDIPKRAQYLRMIADELCRMASHLIAVGTFPMDLGAFTPFVHALREREKINDLLEALCGARLTYNYVRIGGVSFDAPDGFLEDVNAFLKDFEPFIDEFNALLTHNPIFEQRVAHLCPISTQEAIAYGLSGPNLRATGFNYDLRKDAPYACYDEVSFEVPVGLGEIGTQGDSFDRLDVRVREMQQSARILQQCIEQIPQGEIVGKVSRNIRPPKAEAYEAVESARGELGYYIVSDGSKNAYRVKIRSGSFAAMSMVEHLSNNILLADFVSVIASLDLVAPEIDR